MRSEIELLDQLTETLASVSFYRTPDHGDYTWTVSGLIDTERPATEYVRVSRGSWSIRQHDDGRSLHISGDGPTRHAALSEAVDMYEAATAGADTEGGKQ